METGGLTFRKEQSTGTKLDVPCGQCIGCRLERSRQWAMRLVHENQMHEQSSFITLTYAPENLPPYGTLVKSHFQDFMKRYRFWQGQNKLRFFHCGEYGENFGRPHYHALIFGHDWTDKKQKFTTERGDIVYTSDKLLELWGHGIVSTAQVTFESCAYVARYVTKKITGKPATAHYGEIINTETGEISPRRIPEYTTMSRRPGIGKNWYEKFNKDVFPSDEIVIRGKKMKPPRYYTNLFELDRPETYKQIKAQRIAAASTPEKMEHNTWYRLRTREFIQRKTMREQLQRKLK